MCSTRWMSPIVGTVPARPRNEAAQHAAQHGAAQHLPWFLCKRCRSETESEGEKEKMEGKVGAPGKTLSFVKFDSEDEYSSDDDHEYCSDVDHEYSSEVDMASLDMGSESTLATHILSQEKFEEKIALMQKRVELYRNQNIEFDKVIARKEEELARTKEELAKIKEEHAKVKEQHTTMKELLLKIQNARVAVQSSGTETVKKQKCMPQACTTESKTA